MLYEQAKKYLKPGMKVRMTKDGSSNHYDGVEGIMKDECRFIVTKGKISGLSYNFSELLGDEVDILTFEDGVTPWEEPGKQKFKVGDRVRILQNHVWGYAHGKTGVIIQIDENSEYPYKIAFKQPITCGDDWTNGNDTCLEPLPDEPKEEKKLGPPIYFTTPKYFYEPLIFTSGVILKQPKIFNRKESKMNSVIQAIKAKLSSTDKVLVKNGYLNPDGTRTSMYEDQLRELAMKKLIDAEDTKAFREELADELKENE